MINKYPSAFKTSAEFLDAAFYLEKECHLLDQAPFSFEERVSNNSKLTERFAVNQCFAARSWEEKSSHIALMVVDPSRHAHDSRLSNAMKPCTSTAVA
jgi:hypothetical protein